MECWFYRFEVANIFVNLIYCNLIYCNLIYCTLEDEIRPFILNFPTSFDCQPVSMGVYSRDDEIYKFEI